MKQRTILLLLLLCTAIGLQAQDLTVRSFGVAEGDLDARSSTTRRNDRNGTPCALVKVQLPIQGAVFDGVVGNVQFKAGEYWVYMPNGGYLLSIKHPQFHKLDLNLRQLRPVEENFRGVEQLTTYNLVINVPFTGQSQIDDGIAHLVLTVSPSNSSVYINNVLQEVIDGKVMTQVEKGTRPSYRVDAPGYASKSGTILVDETRKDFSVTLTSVKANVQVSCATSGAQIYIDDRLKGTTPWSGQLNPGLHTVEARLAGYRSSKQSINLKNNESLPVSIPALVAVTGSLNVSYQPVDAEVWLDGKLLGKSPNVFRNIKTGTHKVEIKANGYGTHTQQVNIEESQTATINGSLTRGATASTGTPTTPTTPATKPATATTKPATTATTSSDSGNKIQGTVVDNHGEPIIGATVKVVGTAIGAVTDINGKFMLTIPAGKRIRVSYIGYKPVEVSARNNMKIVLKNDWKLNNSLGISAGLNMSSGSGDGLKTKMGWQVGLDYSHFLHHGFGIQSGLSYSAKGYKNDVGPSYSANYIHIPLQLTYSLPLRIGIQLLAGGYAEFGIGGDYFDIINVANSSSPSKMDYGLQFGLRFRLFKRPLRKFYLTGSYELGLNKQLEGFDNKNRNISVTLGYNLF